MSAGAWLRLTPLAKLPLFTHELYSAFLETGGGGSCLTTAATKGTRFVYPQAQAGKGKLCMANSGRSLAIVAALALGASQAWAETVTPKYWPPTDLATYTCTDTVSSFVNRVCYDAPKRHMLILLKATYYPYCGIDADTVQQLLDAPSKGRFYNASIKGRFDCRNVAR